MAKPKHIIVVIGNRGTGKTTFANMHYPDAIRFDPRGIYDSVQHAHTPCGIYDPVQHAHTTCVFVVQSVSQLQHFSKHINWKQEVDAWYCFATSQDLTRYIPTVNQERLQSLTVGQFELYHKPDH